MSSEMTIASPGRCKNLANIERYLLRKVRQVGQDPFEGLEFVFDLVAVAT
jgi:hypothetical protein